MVIAYSILEPTFDEDIQYGKNTSKYSVQYTAPPAFEHHIKANEKSTRLVGERKNLPKPPNRFRNPFKGSGRNDYQPYSIIIAT